MLKQHIVSSLGVISFLLSQGCKPVGLPSGDLGNSNRDDLRARLIERREAIRKWAYVFPDGTAAEGNPSHCNLQEDPGCSQFDVTSWNGYGCLAAHQAGDSETEFARCNDVKNSQSENGQWWRGPHKVGHPDKEDSFSRDMSMGVISYFIAKKDTKAAEKWLEFMWSIGKWVGTGKQKEFQIRLCTDASDSRCSPVGSLYGIWSLAWIEMGYNLEAIAKNPNTNPDDPTKKMYEWEITSQQGIPSETSHNIELAKSKPVESFNVWLTALSAWIRQSVNRNNEIVQASADEIYKAFPKNPFFEFISRGATTHAISQVLDAGYCNVTPPHLIPGREKLIYDWLWQRNPDTWNLQYVSAGHDCIFMINVLLSGLNR